MQLSLQYHKLDTANVKMFRFLFFGVDILIKIHPPTCLCHIICISVLLDVSVALVVFDGIFQRQSKVRKGLENNADFQSNAVAPLTIMQCHYNGHICVLRQLMMFYRLQIRCI